MGEAVALLMMFPVMGNGGTATSQHYKIVIGTIIHSFEYDLGFYPRKTNPKGDVAYDKAKETKTFGVLRP